MTISWKLSAAFCAACCLRFMLLFSLVSFFRARLTHIFVSIVFPFQMCSLPVSPALLLLLWQLCFPFLANSFLWKCWKAEKFIAVKCRRHTADSGTVRLTDRLRERQSVCRLTNWPKGAAFVEKNMATPGHDTLLRQDVPNGKPLNWRRHMDETRADTARRCARCRRHNDNPVELSRTCRVWGMHFKRGYFIHSYTVIKPNNGINIIKCG